MPASQIQDTGKEPLAQRLLPLVLGAFIGLSFLKFGNPPILEKYNQTPANIYEIFFAYPWPSSWGHTLLILVGLLGLGAAMRDLRRPHWTALLPAAWLAWVFISSLSSLDHHLTSFTLKHFAGAVVCFYVGFFALPAARRFTGFWAFILIGFFLVLVVGWQQHLGGLEQTRQYFLTYVYPENPDVPPEYLKKINSTRIFGTLFYPNTLAGFLLLLLPAVLTVIWRAEKRFTRGARIFLVVCTAVAALACLLWSGSKGGWLLMLLLGGIGVLRLDFPRQAKIALVCVALTLGLTGFFYKYAGFFRKGATSVVARFDYWEAAGKTALQNPWTGTGPGTFSVSYRAIKRPESEMARLAHNDYIEQASDSGFPAAILYLSFIVIGLYRSWQIARGNPIDFAIWLGLLGWGLQSAIEFNLYIPALAWTFFIFMGWLWGRQDALRTPKRAAQA